MIELQHLSEPAELTKYRTSNPSNSWDDPAFRGVRAIVRHQLNLGQEGLCVYCESLLDKDAGHVEHIKSKRRHPPLTFAFDNLAHSCNGPAHCGHHKKGQLLPLEPRSGCNRFFVLIALDGRLDAASGLTSAESQAAIGTIRILGLDAPAIAWQRKGFADAVHCLPSEDRSEFIATIPFRWILKGL